MVDFKEFSRQSLESEKIIFNLRAEMYIHLKKYNYISFNSQLANALTSMMKNSTRLRKWAFNIERMPYSLSTSELSVIQELLLDNSLTGVAQKSNISKLPQHTDYRGDVSDLLQKMKEFVILQDDMMYEITRSFLQDATS